MKRRYHATDLAAYARCPRAWWYERHEELVRLAPTELEERLRARRAALGRRARNDPETQLLERLLERHARFSRGRGAHARDARRTLAPRRAGCLVPAAVLMVLLLAIFAQLV